MNNNYFLLSINNPNKIGSIGLNKILSIFDILTYLILLIFKSSNNPLFKHDVKSPFPKEDYNGLLYSSNKIYPYSSKRFIVLDVS